MSTVSSKSLILSQPKSGQNDSVSAPILTHATVTTESFVETKVEIPGVDPSTVDVQFEDNTLYIKCERGVLSLPINPAVDASKIKADILWGMLTLSVPLPAPPVSRNIKVSVHDAVKHAPTKTSSKFTEEE